MQLIEKLLGISPDNGDGSLETIVFVLLPALALGGVLWLVRQRARNRLR